MANRTKSAIKRAGRSYRLAQNSKMDRIKCVVIGAGVVGLAVARAMAARGREVIVLEAGEAVGTGTSSRNSEVIHAGFYYPRGLLKADLCMRGRAMHNFPK